MWINCLSIDLAQIKPNKGLAELDSLERRLEMLIAEQERLQAEYDGLAYARARALAYPSLSEFVEAYTEKEIGEDSTKWDAYVTKYNQVREDNPKE